MSPLQVRLPGWPSQRWEQHKQDIALAYATGQSCLLLLLPIGIMFHRVVLRKISTLLGANKRLLLLLKTLIDRFDRASRVLVRPQTTMAVFGAPSIFFLPFHVRIRVSMAADNES